MRKVRYLRFAVALAAVLAVFASMQHHGVAVGSICMLCPVGFLSLTAASGSVAWALVPGVVAGLAIVLLVGRAFCSWLCPTGALKNLFGGRSPRGVAGRAGRAPGPCAHSCSAGSLKARAVVLIVLLAVSFVVHFPVFCLICPIGLALGTVYAVSRAFVLWQPGWELAIFPLMLLAEVFLFKRWCSDICPWGFALSLVAKVRTKLGFAVGPRSKAPAGRFIMTAPCRVRDFATRRAPWTRYATTGFSASGSPGFRLQARGAGYRCSRRRLWFWQPRPH